MHSTADEKLISLFVTEHAPHFHAKKGAICNKKKKPRLHKHQISKHNAPSEVLVLNKFQVLFVSSFLFVPGVVSSYMALDDDGFLFEELEVPPAEEAPDVPLDGDGSPGLGAAPLFLQLLVQKLLEEHLTHTHTSKYAAVLSQNVSSFMNWHLGESQLVLPFLCTNHVQ